jgi:hypothetical protein
MGIWKEAVVAVFIILMHRLRNLLINFVSRRGTSGYSGTATAIPVFFLAVTKRKNERIDMYVCCNSSSQAVFEKRDTGMKHHSASNRNEYQGYLLGAGGDVKVGGCLGLKPYHLQLPPV